jgi:hypothetical protein
LVLESLQDRVNVREGDQQRRMSKAQIGAKKFANRFAESGDPKILLSVLKITDERRRKSEDAASRTATVEEDDLTNEEILRWFLERNGSESGHEDPELTADGKVEKS